MAKWISKAINPANKGALHRALGVPIGKTIPRSKVVAASHSDNPKLRHRAQMALNLRKLNPWEIMHDKSGYWVVKKDTGAKVHEVPHKTRAEALAHMKALYASEGVGTSAGAMMKRGTKMVG